MIKIIGSTLVFFSLCNTALAADIIPNPPPAAPVFENVPKPLSNWEGRYAGVSFGYALNDTSSLAVTNNTTGNIVSDRKFMESGGLVVGLFVGYNTSYENFVVGVEGDLDFANVDDTNGIFGGGSASFDITMQGSVRGRVGVEIGPALIYSTFGLAVADINYSAVASDGTGNTEDEIAYGYTLGVGVDYAITQQVFARTEYRYTDYVAGDFSSAGDTFGFDFDTKLHTVRAGAGVKF